jgi:NADH/NAD ratio-sensing transcriptional regulator Rex
MNFAPERLSVPDGVVVQTVDIAASLAILSTKLKVILDKRDS